MSVKYQVLSNPCLYREALLKEEEMEEEQDKDKDKEEEGIRGEKKMDKEGDETRHKRRSI